MCSQGKCPTKRQKNVLNVSKLSFFFPDETNTDCDSDDDGPNDVEIMSTSSSPVNVNPIDKLYLMQNSYFQ